MHIPLPKFRREVKAPTLTEQRYSLAAYQLATAIDISLEDAQGWVDMAARRARGIRE